MQIIDQCYMTLSQNYTTTSRCLSTLTPALLGDLRTAEDITLAHLSLKPLVKAAVWLWPRIVKQSPDYERFQPWVRDSCLEE